MAAGRWRSDDVRGFLLGGQIAAHLRQRQRQQEQAGQLGGEGLGRGHADLHAGARDVDSLHSRTMALVATLQMVSVCCMPSERACLSAASVSAVSPDCEIVTTSARGFGTLSR